MIDLPDIGLATPADARAIAVLSRDEIEHGFRWRWTPERIGRAIRAPDINVVVARQAGVVAGFALMQYDADRAHLLLLGVSPAQRRRGLATALLAWLEDTLRVAGIARVQVEVRAGNAAAIALYGRLGYEQVNATRGYYQGLETALHLVKELGPGDGP
jgi:ribosomal-protein-alanine N-acetyltransferase